MKKEYIKPTMKSYRIKIPCLFQYSVNPYKDGGKQTYGDVED